MRRALAVAVALAAVTLVGPSGAHAVVPAGNLVQNPGAEAGQGADDSNGGFPPPQWAPSGGFTAVQYGTPLFPTQTVSNSIGGGANFFSGGPTDASSLGEQIIDVAAAAPEIDAGQVSAELRGHLGGFSTDGDNAKVTAAFEDATADVLFGTLQIGPVTAVERSSQTTLLPRSTRTPVPVGTRQIRFTVTATRAAGAYNDGYADNLSLMLDRDPVAVNDSATVAQDAGATAIAVLANDTDPDGGPKLVASATQPANGTVVVVGGGTGVTFKPNAGYCNSQAGGGAATFTYTLNGGSAATVAVRVTCRPPPGPITPPPPGPIMAPPPGPIMAPPQLPAAPGPLTGPCARGASLGSKRGRSAAGPGCATGPCARGASTGPSARAAANLTGTPGSDTLIGTMQNDTIAGLGGDDCVLGNLGNDTIDGGVGDDRIQGDYVCPPGARDPRFCARGGAGRDRIRGGSGSDRLSGDGGNDSISGDGGSDRVSGGSGNDRLTGGSGDDRLSGGSGRDRVDAGSGDDRVGGGTGDDRLSGGSGRDQIDAGSGNDTVSARDRQRDRIRCGPGRDRVTADRTDEVSRDCERVRRRR